ncbi:MAG: efflux RND transporter periplasmic adaptor subunit [Cyanobacteria bacterium]|nr:efflux RND transporter periplasmic adaptor subunit [Cyanobacteriota bacterium]
MIGSAPRGSVAGAAGSVLLGLLITGCQAGKPPPRILPVQVAPVQLSSFRDSVDTISTLESIGEVNLAAQATGRIQSLLVQQGDRVRRGQLLLVLDQAQGRAEVAKLQAEVETNRLNFQRYNYLVKQGAASAFQRDEFRQRYISSRQELIARRADLGFRDLRAPIDGTIGDLTVKQGDVIQAGVPFSSLIRNDRLLARVEVPALYASRLRLGQPVILMDPASNRPLAEAPLRSIDPGVVPGSQSLLAKAEFDNSGQRLRNGLRTRTRLILDVRRQPSVPFTAVTQISGQSFVYGVGSLARLRERPGRADLAAAARMPAGTRFALQTPVQLGPLQDNRYPVQAGLSEGQPVITANLLSLRHGLPVQVR